MRYRKIGNYVGVLFESSDRILEQSMGARNWVGKRVVVPGPLGYIGWRAGTTTPFLLGS